MTAAAIDLHAVALAGLARELRGGCNKLANGYCTTTACLLRGGWKRTDPPVDDCRIATCEALERLQALEALYAEVRNLREKMPD